MPIQHDPTFDCPNIVRYSRERSDGSSEIVCNNRFAKSITDALAASMIPAGLDPDQPLVGECAIIMTSSMEAASKVKAVLKQWMIDNHVGELESLK